MTQYAFPPATQTRLSNLSSKVKEEKEKRRAVIEAVFQRRREIYRQFYQKKRQLKAGGEVL